MSLIVFAIVVLIIAALVVWGVQQVPQFAPFSGLIVLLICVLAALAIAQRAGIL